MIENSAHTVQDVLLKECEEFQQLCERHKELDSRLSDLAGKHFLSDSEKVEEITIKKRKLAIKDRMAVMIRSH